MMSDGSGDVSMSKLTEGAGRSKRAGVPVRYFQCFICITNLNLVIHCKGQAAVRR